MSRCFLITGGESTGTRMLVRSFVLLGIPEIEIDRRFDWPYGELDLPDGDIVFHAGIPRGGEWLDLWEVSKRFRNEGKEVYPLVMTREWNATAQSQVNRKFVDTLEQAEENLRQAYRAITQQLNGYIFVSYEQFCLEPQYRASIFKRFNLKNSPIDIHYGNRQYYKGEK